MPRVGPGGQQPGSQQPKPKPKPISVGSPNPSGPGPKIGELSVVPIPSQYVAIVQRVAQNTGMPVAVVAAQINLESGWNPNARSPAGAVGIAQFLPSTWEGLHCAGSWWFPYDAFNCYQTFMRQLIAWAGGNLRQALAAYNAGEGNWQAGLGYADTILNEAGGGASVSPGGISVGNITLPPLPSTAQDNWSDYVGNAADAFEDAVRKLGTHSATMMAITRVNEEYSNG